MKRSQSLIVAYLVSWSAEPAYAEVSIRIDDTNSNHYRRYDFSNSLGAKYGGVYVMVTNGISWNPNIRVEVEGSFA
jgi:hypothetical protein